MLGIKPTTNIKMTKILALICQNLKDLNFIVGVQLITLRSRSLYDTYHYWTSNETFTSVTSGSKFHGVVLFAVKYIPTSKVNR